MDTKKINTLKKTNNENFLFEIGYEKYVYVGEKVFSFETKELGFNDIRFPYPYEEENIHFMLHQKRITIQE